MTIHAPEHFVFTRMTRAQNVIKRAPKSSREPGWDCGRLTKTIDKGHNNIFHRYFIPYRNGFPYLGIEVTKRNPVVCRKLNIVGAQVTHMLARLFADSVGDFGFDLAPKQKCKMD